MSDRLNITVMLGGPSAEREVSLRSGAEVARALRSLGHKVNEVDPQDSSWPLPAGTDVVFLALHGTYGEDGSLMGLLRMAGVPFVGCDIFASAVAMDKVLTKQVVAAEGMPVVPYVWFTRAELKAKKGALLEGIKKALKPVQ